MEEKKSCSSCKNKREGFVLSKQEKNYVYASIGIIFFTVYGIIQLVKDIISLF